MLNLFTRRTRRRSGLRQKGQSFVEFALILPVLLLILLFGIDFGRVFLGWINLNNVAKVAANYAAQNPTASWAAGSEYQTLIANDMAGINCTTTTPYPAPVFTGAGTPGNPVHVSIGCQFQLLTPFLDIFIADPVTVTGGSAFPVRSGLIPGATLIPVVPTLTPTPTATATPVPTATPSPTATIPGSTPTPTPTATPVPTPTPVPQCTVPNFHNTNTIDAQNTWTNTAGFGTTVLFNPLVGGTQGHYSIKDQSLAAGTTGPCGTTVITVYSKNQHP